MGASPGIVYLVGADPSDVGLTTARGHSLLRRPDVIIHDRPVSRALLAHGQPGGRAH